MKEILCRNSKLKKAKTQAINAIAIFMILFLNILT